MFGNHPGIDDVPQPILLDESEDLSGYRYMEGHYALPTIEQGFDLADVVCILREPRARFLSHYTFWRSWGPELRDQWLPYDVPRAARQSLVAYCADPAAAHQTDNLIARLIIGPHAMIPADGMIAVEDGPTLISLGVERLDALGFVDVLERGDAAFDALETWFGSPLERVHLNETDLDDGPPIDAAELTDPATLVAIDQRTAIDRALWQHVATRCGLSDVDARRLGNDTFAASLNRLVERAALRASTTQNPGSPVARAVAWLRRRTSSRPQ